MFIQEWQDQMLDRNIEMHESAHFSFLWNSTIPMETVSTFFIQNHLDPFEKFSNFHFENLFTIPCYLTFQSFLPNSYSHGMYVYIATASHNVQSMYVSGCRCLTEHICVHLF